MSRRAGQGFFVCVALGGGLLQAGSASAERELAPIVARYAQSGPTGETVVELRADAHASRMRREGSMALGPDEASGTPRFEERRIDVALLGKIQRQAVEAGLCRARTTPGSSVGGAWDLEVILASGRRCHVHRRARLEVEPKLAALREAVMASFERGQPIAEQPGGPPR